MDVWTEGSVRVLAMPMLHGFFWQSTIQKQATPHVREARCLSFFLPLHQIEVFFFRSALQRHELPKCNNLEIFRK
jgi:hypothetical protein